MTLYLVAIIYPGCVLYLFMIIITFMQQSEIDFYSDELTIRPITKFCFLL